MLLSISAIDDDLSNIQLKRVICDESDTLSISEIVGMMPKSQASPEQIETYLNQERSKRRQMLQKFLDQCRKFQVSSWTTISLPILISQQVFSFDITIFIFRLPLMCTSSRAIRLLMQSSNLFLFCTLNC